MVKPIEQMTITDDFMFGAVIHPHTLQEILDTIDAHPNWSDEQAAENVEFN